MEGDLAAAAAATTAAMVPVLRGVGYGVWDRIRKDAVEQTGDAAENWLRQVVVRLFAHRKEGGNADLDAAAPTEVLIRDDAAKALTGLASDPDNELYRLLLTNLIEHAAKSAPDPVGLLRELISAAPDSVAERKAPKTGDVDQSRISGVAIAITGEARDVSVHKP